MGGPRMESVGEFAADGLAVGRDDDQALLVRQGLQRLATQNQRQGDQRTNHDEHHEMFDHSLAQPDQVFDINQHLDDITRLTQRWCRFDHRDVRRLGVAAA